MFCRLLNFHRIFHSLVRPPCRNFMRLAAPLVMIIGRAELDLEYDRLLINNKGSGTLLHISLGIFISGPGPIWKNILIVQYGPGPYGPGP